MKDRKNIILPAFLFLTIFIIIFITYIHVWEHSQEKFKFENVAIISIKHYYKSGGDLHWSVSGFRVFIDSDERPIDFPLKYWNKIIKEGSKVNIIARKSFFGNELDGLEINSVTSQ